MAVVLLILKVIGVVLLVLLALVVLVLLTPMGAAGDWRAGTLSVRLKIGPLSFALWPRAEKPPPAKTGGKPAGERPSPAQPAPQAQAAAPKPPEPAAQKPVPPPSKAAAPEPEKTEKASPLPAFLQKRLDAAIAYARKDPVAFAGTMLGHAGWFTKRLLKGLRIRHLCIWWSITGEDAAQTALLFGQMMTLSNNLLTYLRQFISIEADSLWLEPDFTGQQRSRRAVSGQLTARPGTLLLLAARFGWRLWHDPNFQPSDQ